jgi:hypothetical protein
MATCELGIEKNRQASHIKTGLCASHQRRIGYTENKKRTNNKIDELNGSLKLIRSWPEF